ncbi:MAG: hypothetical protein ACLQDQ_08555 [Myxococcaceae bacterium]
MASLVLIYFGSGWLLAWGFPYRLSPRRLRWFIKLGAVGLGFGLWFACETLSNGLLLYEARLYGVRGIAAGTPLLLLAHYYLWILLLLVVALRFPKASAATKA